MGRTFVVVRDAVALYRVLPFLALRFALAALAFAYLSQTVGLLLTSPTNAGLITGPLVIFSPLADRLFFGARPSRPVLVTVSSNLVGMVLLAGGGPDGACSTCSARRFGTAHSLPLPLCCQARRGRPRLRAVALDGARLRHALAPLPAGYTPAAGGLARAPGDGARRVRRGVLVQTFVQQRITAGRTAVILTMEPVFAVLFGYWLAGDRLVTVQMAGGPDPLRARRRGGRAGAHRP